MTYPPTNIVGGPAVAVEAETRNHSFLIDARRENVEGREGGIRTAKSRINGRVKRSNDSFGRTDKSAGAAVVAVRARNRSFVVMLDAGVSELTGIPFIAGKSVTKVPGTSKVSKAFPGRRTKPKVRPLATV